ncbi:MAG TPA: CHASE2 domain-containing protein [Spirochaetota bacterium]|nr:CHASE2 domain-containing protein [Spirochaetota bacterium]
MAGRVPVLVRVFIVVFLVVVGATLAGFFETLELQLADQRFRLRGTQPVHPEIVHIDIDTDALKAEGNWATWHAGRHAIAFNILRRLGVKALGVDIFFTERGERRFAVDKLKHTGRQNFSLVEIQRVVPDSSGLFITAMTNARFVVLAQLFENQPLHERYTYYRENRSNSLRVQDGKFRVPLPAAFPVLRNQSNITPVLAEYAAAAAGTGIAQVDPDTDGVVRRAPLFFRLGGHIYPSLGLSTALVARRLTLADLAPGTERKEIVFARGTNRLVIPVRRDGSIYVNWRGGVTDAHPRISWSALKWLGYGMVLREMKAVANRVGEEALFDRERFLQLPEIEQLQREFGDGTPLAGPLAIRPEDRDSVAIVEEVWSRLVVATLLQKMLDENPRLSLADFCRQTGLEDNPGVREFFFGMKYAGILMRDSRLVGSALATTDARRLGIEDSKLFEEYRLLIGNERPDSGERPYFFYPAPIVESLKGPLYGTWLHGKICLYGLTASGTHDLNPVPMASRYPMVGVHATVADNILSSNPMTRVPRSVNLAIVLGLAILSGLLFLRTRSAVMAVSAFLMVCALVAVNWFFFSTQDLWLEIVPPLVLVVGFFVSAIVHNYLGEEREKKRIRGAFSRYVAPALVDQIILDPGMLRLGGEKRVCTVFFSDIAGFTTLSEGLSPEQLVEFLNTYLTEVTDIILAHGGMLDKYEGDAVMAVFGAPLLQPDHAERACRAALAVQARLSELRAAWLERGLPAFITRIGLNSGEMVVGNMGSRERFDYTVIGDAVNLGSRLEGANKQYGTYLMISQATRDLAGPERFVTRELDMIRVKGKAEPVRVFELIDTV